jgi:hypothetical protein
VQVGEHAQPGNARGQVQNLDQPDRNKTEISVNDQRSL